VSGGDAAARFTQLKALAAQFPGESQLDLSIYWQNEHGQAGVSSAADGFSVFFNSHMQPVESLDEAAGILRGIFADEIVLATGYEKDIPVYRAFAPASDPTLGFNKLDRSHHSVDVPRIDDLTIETWSSGLQLPKGSE